MKTIALLSAGMLIYIYFGYCAILRLFSKRASSADNPTPTTPHAITVLITAHNEAHSIAARIQNVLSCDYDGPPVQILVGSDGSTDGTDEIVNSYKNPNVQLFRPQFRVGKSDTQNQAISHVTGEIVVFTDADTQFSTEFLREIARPFQNHTVGAVDGHLIFLSNGTSEEISRAQGTYWAQELLIRERESALGTLAVVSGACFAVRKSLLKPIPADVGEDCVVPLQVVSQGFLVVHASKAVAFDYAASESRSEFRGRVRTTLRNWQGTFLYVHLLNPFRHTGYALALWSHKILRWLSPVFLVTWIFAAIVSSSAFSRLSLLTTVPATLFCAAGCVVCILPSFRILPGLRYIWAFLVLNAGLATGLWKVVLGRTITFYR